MKEIETYILYSSRSPGNIRGFPAKSLLEFFRQIIPSYCMVERRAQVGVKIVEIGVNWYRLLGGHGSI